MSFDPSEVQPWECVAATGGNGELEPVPARRVASPADESRASWTRADWHVADPALASKYARALGAGRNAA